MNTIISSAASGLFIVFMVSTNNLLKDEQKIAQTQLLMNYNVHVLCNGILAGLVSVTAACARIELWAAAIIGVLGGMIFYTSREVFIRLEIDDPLEITEIHAICGVWSLAAVGIFDLKTGWLYTGKPEQMLIQLLASASYIVWSGLLSFVFFYSLKQNRKLRVDMLFETTGLDLLPISKD
jgi:Amt family ammonium transporter